MRRVDITGVISGLGFFKRESEICEVTFQGCERRGRRQRRGVHGALRAALRDGTEFPSFTGRLTRSAPGARRASGASDRGYG